MKASELIKAIQEHIDEFGDLDVRVDVGLDAEYCEQSRGMLEKWLELFPARQTGGGRHVKHKGSPEA